ncbi:MAG: cytidylate kinase-like family protein [Mesorhizobium sp.]|nr:MAG: cytidylate kinase-like family protein [Mesorhizobium sp.]
MPKKKAMKTRNTARPVEVTVSPEIRRMMRKFGLTEEEALRMMREGNAALYGSSAGHGRQGS